MRVGNAPENAQPSAGAWAQKSSTRTAAGQLGQREQESHLPKLIYINTIILHE